jgi:hypothetical protein
LIQISQCCQLRPPLNLQIGSLLKIIKKTPALKQAMSPFLIDGYQQRPPPRNFTPVPVAARTRICLSNHQICLFILNPVVF